MAWCPAVPSPPVWPGPTQPQGLPVVSCPAGCPSLAAAPAAEGGAEAAAPMAPPSAPPGCSVACTSRGGQVTQPVVPPAPASKAASAATGCRLPRCRSDAEGCAALASGVGSGGGASPRSGFPVKLRMWLRGQGHRCCRSNSRGDCRWPSCCSACCCGCCSTSGGSGSGGGGWCAVCCCEAGCCWGSRLHLPNRSLAGGSSGSCPSYLPMNMQQPWHRRLPALGCECQRTLPPPQCEHTI